MATAHRDRYGPPHRRERKRVGHIIYRDGGFACWRCLHWFPHGTPWDLGHDRDTGQWMGAECRPCNRSEGATYGNQMREAGTWVSADW